MSREEDTNRRHEFLQYSFYNIEKRCKGKKKKTFDKTYNFSQLLNLIALLREPPQQEESLEASRLANSGT